MGPVLTGLDRLTTFGFSLPGRGRVAVLCNATTVAADWTPTLTAVSRLPGVDVVRILAPQHGFAAEKQDNMIPSSDGMHPRLGVPIHSLYGARQVPEPAVLRDVDAVLVDLQDVGTRVYTFVSSALLTMHVAAECGVPVVVLDRPNPIGSRCEGPVLHAAFTSYVGMLDVPLRHGLTIGELCLYGAYHLRLITAGDVERIVAAARTYPEQHPGDDGWLRIIGLQGWRRTQYHDDTALPWTMPSPNLPTLTSTCVYPGQVVLEGTNLTEGRGTTRPFELWGAPYLDPEAVAAILNDRGMLTGDGWCGRPDTLLDGTLLREVAFEPVHQKYAGETVRGFQLHIIDRERYQPVAATTALVGAVRQAHPETFAYRPPPYEYEAERLAIDLIYGTDAVRLGLEDGTPLPELVAGWDEPLAQYRRRIAPFLLYGVLGPSHG